MEPRMPSSVHPGAVRSGGHPGCRKGPASCRQDLRSKFRARGSSGASSAGQDAQLYGSQDGRRYSVANNLGARCRVDLPRLSHRIKGKPSSQPFGPEIAQAVAQIFNLPYRLQPAGRWQSRSARICRRSADFKSAIRRSVAETQPKYTAETGRSQRRNCFCKSLRPARLCGAFPFPQTAQAATVLADTDGLQVCATSAQQVFPYSLAGTTGTE